DGARAPCRIDDAGRRGDVTELPALLAVVETVRFGAEAAAGAERNVEIQPAVVVVVGPPGAVLIARRLDARRADHVDEAAVAAVPQEYRPCPVVADVQVETAVAVEIADRRVVGRTFVREAGGGGHVVESRHGR